MNTLMEYKGYRAKIEYDKDDNIFVGTVLGLNDILSFHGSSVEELEQGFTNCIENYFEYCRKIGKKPEKEFRGVFNVRINPESHRKAALEAARVGITMNQFVSEAIDEKLAANSSYS
ncbi:MAG: type II toxin-antitoxin system HicB family antitoxin [Lachnospiraceae bacterium]|nr:type II toxin-antitoxin system HicB family antitoxin [Lachnospiraceae bacterium]